MTSFICKAGITESAPTVPWDITYYTDLLSRYNILSRGSKGDQQGIKSSVCSCNASAKRAIILSSTIALQQTGCKGTPLSVYSRTRCLNRMSCQHKLCSVRRMQTRATYMKIICSPSFLPRSAVHRAAKMPSCLIMFPKLCIAEQACPGHVQDHAATFLNIF